VAAAAIDSPPPLFVAIVGSAPSVRPLKTRVPAPRLCQTRSCCPSDETACVCARARQVPLNCQTKKKKKEKKKKTTVSREIEQKKKKKSHSISTG